ncbi:MAG: MarR family winged helix-turn-helix transcriptional regulator [Candidatus Methylacidiphilales bacterium]
MEDKTNCKSDFGTPLAYKFNLLAKNYYGAAAAHFTNFDFDKYFYVLMVIGNHEKITQQCLAKYFDIDKASIVRIIDYLTDKGLVIREKNALDRREHMIVCTEKGKTYIPQINEAFNLVNNSAFKNFTEQEQTIFFEMLNRMLENISGLPAEYYELKYVKSNNVSK